MNRDLLYRCKNEIVELRDALRIARARLDTLDTIAYLAGMRQSGGVMSPDVVRLLEEELAKPSAEGVSGNNRNAPPATFPSESCP